MKQIIETLKARRLELGWSQATLAEKMDKHQGSIWQIESGKVDPRLYTLDLWARTLGLKLQLVADPDGMPVE